MSNSCFQCGAVLVGRSDKKFCNTDCKNAYNLSTKKSLPPHVRERDAHHHRNYRILSELLGESKLVETDKATLEQSGFRFEFHMGTFLSKQGVTYHYVYDCAYSLLSEQAVKVLRK